MAARIDTRIGKQNDLLPRDVVEFSLTPFPGSRQRNSSSIVFTRSGESMLGLSNRVAYHLNASGQSQAIVSTGTHIVTERRGLTRCNYSCARLLRLICAPLLRACRLKRDRHRLKMCWCQSAHRPVVSGICRMRLLLRPCPIASKTFWNWVCSVTISNATFFNKIASMKESSQSATCP